MILVRTFLKCTLVGSLALTGGANLHAQTATNATADSTVVVAPIPPPKWESSVALGFSLTSGNSDTLLFTGSISTQRKDPVNEWSFGADGAYGESSGSVDNQMAHAYGQYNRLFTERFYAYGRVDALYDGIADIDYRVNLSPGLGYYAIKKPRTSLSFEIGPGFVFEKKGGVVDNYPTVRFAERFEQKLGAAAKLWEYVSYLPDVSDFGNYQINAEIGIDAPIAKKLSLRVVASDTYSSQPAAGKKPNDLKLVSALAYAF